MKKNHGQDGEFEHRDYNVHNISEATSPELLMDIEFYRSLGIQDFEMKLIRSILDSHEEVIVNKDGLLKLAKHSPLGGFTAIERLKEGGVELSLEEEYFVVGINSESDFAHRQNVAFLMEMLNCMTLAGLRQMRKDASKVPGVRDDLGTKKYRKYIDSEVERLGSHYGWDTILASAEISRDAHAMAVILNSFAVGNPDMEGLKKLEEDIPTIFAVR